MHVVDDSEARGLEAESIIATLLQQLHREKVISTWRAATVDEQPLGVDFVAVRHGQEIPIQVKRRSKHYNRFNRRHPDWKGVKIAVWPRRKKERQEQSDYMLHRILKVKELLLDRLLCYPKEPKEG